MNDGMRASSSSSATRAIIRAAALPMQWWLPWLKVRIWAGLAADVEPVGVGAVLARVAVGGAVAEQHLATGRDRHVVQLDVAGGGAGQALHR